MGLVRLAAALLIMRLLTRYLWRKLIGLRYVLARVVKLTVLCSVLRVWLLAIPLEISILAQAPPPGVDPRHGL